MTKDMKAWPEFLQQFEAHQYAVRPATQTRQGYELFMVDLSDWKLRFSNKTPLIWVKADILSNCRISN